MNLDDVPREPKQLKRFLDQIPMTPVAHDGLPPEGLYATHSGVLTIGESELRVYQLSDGTRVFDTDDVQRFFLGLGGDE
jgi:hypothetical protein